MPIIRTKSKKTSSAFALQANACMWYVDFQIGERFIIPSSEFRIVQNLWGLDIDGTLQGAGGVGGLLSVNSYTSTNNSPFSILNSQLDETYLPTYDANGNISEYVNSADGTISAHYDYSPFGEQILASGTLADIFTHRFSTKPFCPYTGLVEYQYRKYHPSLGRWLSRDPIGERGGLNLYVMCGNNGVNKFDLLGKADVQNNSSYRVVIFGSEHFQYYDKCKLKGVDEDGKISAIFMVLENKSNSNGLIEDFDGIIDYSGKPYKTGGDLFFEISDSADGFNITKRKKEFESILQSFRDLVSGSGYKDWKGKEYAFWGNEGNNTVNKNPIEHCQGTITRLTEVRSTILECSLNYNGKKEKEFNKKTIERIDEVINQIKDAIKILKDRNGFTR